MQDIIVLSMEEHDNNSLAVALHERTELSICEAYVFALRSFANNFSDGISATSASIPPPSLQQLVQVANDPDNEAKKQAKATERKATHSLALSII